MKLLRRILPFLLIAACSYFLFVYVLRQLSHSPAVDASQTAALDANVPNTPATRVPHATPRPGQIPELTIKQLGNFVYDHDTSTVIPDDVRQLTGSTLRITGFMVPIDQADEVSRFALVPSLFSCCYGQPPTVQHTITVTCPKGRTVAYTKKAVTVEGRLTVGEVKDEGYVTSLFSMTCMNVTKVSP